MALNDATTDMIDIVDLKDCADCLTTLASWHQGEWSDLNPGETIKQRIKRMQSYLNDSFIPSTFVACNKTILGSAAIVATDMETRPDLTPWLASVFVAPEYRNNGIGKQLVLHVMNRAKTEGIKTLYLFTTDKEDYYQKLGWIINSVVQYHGHQVTIMQITLNPA